MEHTGSESLIASADCVTVASVKCDSDQVSKALTTSAVDHLIHGERTDSDFLITHSSVSFIYLHLCGRAFLFS
jgi:hypothetical protein